MTTPLWCLLVACILPLIFAGVGTRYKQQDLGDVDLGEPRAQNAKLTGAGGRAVAAQANAWEALAVFAPAVLTNHMLTGGAGIASTVAIAWVALRILHGVAYVAGISPLRILGFVGALGCSITLFVIAA